MYRILIRYISQIMLIEHTISFEAYYKYKICESSRRKKNIQQKI